MTAIIGVILTLVLMEGLLSVDNALFIAARVEHLPAQQRKRALTAGLVGAYVFRGGALVAASWLMGNPWVRLAGGGYLVYLMVAHFWGRREVTAKGFRKAVPGFWMTVLSVELADIAFSIDNVVAAVALSPRLWVVVLGVFLGILTMRFVAGIFVDLMAKMPVLKPIAYVLVGYVGAALIVEELAHFHLGEAGKVAGIGIIITAGLAHDHVQRKRGKEAK